MTLENAITLIVGVTMDDLRGKSHTMDCRYGRAMYSKLSGKTKVELSRVLLKTYSTITLYQEMYDRYLATDEEFSYMVERVKSLIQ